ALLDWSTREVRSLTHETSRDRSWNIVGWSTDGQRLYANRINAGFTDASVWRIDAASGKADELTPHKQPALILASAVAPDERFVAVTSNARDGRNQAALFDAVKREYRWITSGSWEAESGGFSPDGKRLAYSINADGRSDVYLYDSVGGRSEKLALPTGVNAAG